MEVYLIEKKTEMNSKQLPCHMLSDAYKQIGETSSAVRLFHRSRRLFKHSHNPALWQLFILGLHQCFTNVSVWLTVGVVGLLLSFAAIYACR